MSEGLAHLVRQTDGALYVGEYDALFAQVIAVVFLDVRTGAADHDIREDTVADAFGDFLELSLALFGCQDLFRFEDIGIINRLLVGNQDGILSVDFGKEAFNITAIGLLKCRIVMVPFK